MTSVLNVAPSESSSRDVGLGEVLHALLASLWQRKLLISVIVAIALAFGVIAALAIPPSYRTEAYIRGGFVASNAVKKDDSKTSPYIGLDLARVIETQSRVLQSQSLARRVVQQLGLERLRSEVVEANWLPQGLYASGADAKDDRIDQAGARLLNRLSVSSDVMRTYLIKVSYTGKDSALAVSITNAFVAEFLRSSNLQALSQQRSVEDSALSKYLATLGERHPRVAQAKMRLANTDELLREQLGETPEALLNSAGESISRATAATTARRPNPRLVIGLFLCVGLTAGVAVALRSERRRWRDAFSHYVRPLGQGAIAA